MTPSRKRELAGDLIERYRASERQACQAMQLSRTVYRYKSVAADSSALQMRIKEITQTRVHYGYRRVLVDVNYPDRSATTILAGGSGE